MSPYTCSINNPQYSIHLMESTKISRCMSILTDTSYIRTITNAKRWMLPSYEKGLGHLFELFAFLDNCPFICMV